MPRICLKISAELENLASFECPGEDFRWFLKICCGNCGEVTDWVYVSQEEQLPVKGMKFEVDGGTNLENLGPLCVLIGIFFNVSRLCPSRQSLYKMAELTV